MRLIISIAILILISSCKGKKDTLTFADENVQKMYIQYNEAPTDQNARLFNATSIQYLSLQPDAQDKKELLLAGLEVAEKHNLVPAKSTFLISLIRDYEGNKETADRIYELAMMMKSAQKEAAAMSKKKAARRSGRAESPPPDSSTRNPSPAPSPAGTSHVANGQRSLGDLTYRWRREMQKRRRKGR